MRRTWREMVLMGTLVATMPVQGRAQTVWQPDSGTGRYTNPILYADYSDPDAIRVGADYYMVASSFTAVPGLPILHSKDLVNWRLIGHALPRQVPDSVFATPQHGKGVWAPAIRYHQNRFWIYYPDPDFGIYLVTATDPAGPWSHPILVKGGKGLIDPCPLFDDDGQVYLVHGWARSRAGFANVLTLNRLSADGTRTQDAGHIIINGDTLPGYRTLEGPKLYKHGGYYWVFAPAGGVKPGWQSVFRAKHIDGPYEDRIVLAQGKTDINGPHQGAWVDTVTGEQWFLHFQDLDAYGRVVHLQPMTWRPDGWPVMGTDDDGDGQGEPVRTWRKPDVGHVRVALDGPATTDEFEATTLGLQWQWPANPQAQWWSLTARPGYLRLFGQPRPTSDSLFLAPAILQQKWSAPAFVVTAQVELSARLDGDETGLIVFGQDYAWIGLRKTAAGLVLVQRTAHGAKDGKPEIDIVSRPWADSRVTLRVQVAAGGVCTFSYSRDGAAFETFGAAFTATPGVWIGAKVGVFAATAPGTPARAPGHADWAWFRITKP